MTPFFPLGHQLNDSFFPWNKVYNEHKLGLCIGLPKQLIEARKIWTLSLLCCAFLTTTVEQKITGRREREKEDREQFEFMTRESESTMRIYIEISVSCTLRPPTTTCFMAEIHSCCKIYGIKCLQHSAVWYQSFAKIWKWLTFQQIGLCATCATTKNGYTYNVLLYGQINTCWVQ